MVLESLLDDEALVRRPFFMLPFGLVASSVALWVSFYALAPFASTTGLLAVAFLTVAAAPLLHSLFARQETQSAHGAGKAGGFFGRNLGLVKIYAWLFVGVAASYAFWYALLAGAPDTVCAGSACLAVPETGEVFLEQESTLQSIAGLRERLTGEVVARRRACSAQALCWFHVIFSNNVSVLFMAVLFSFIFGAGAVFLIGWNASVVGVSVGQSLAALQPLRFLGLLPHGVPELTGYFLGAIAGGLWSEALARKAHRTGEFSRVSRDSLALLALAVFSLLVGALVEALLIVRREGEALGLSLGYVLLLGVLAWRGAGGRAL